MQKNCYFSPFSGKRSYYSGEQNKFPGSKWKKQAQMQFILYVQGMMCPSNCVVIFQAFYMKYQPGAFRIT